MKYIFSLALVTIVYFQGAKSTKFLENFVKEMGLILDEPLASEQVIQVTIYPEPLEYDTCQNY